MSLRINDRFLIGRTEEQRKDLAERRSAATANEIFLYRKFGDIPMTPEERAKWRRAGARKKALDATPKW